MMPLSCKKKYTLQVYAGLQNFVDTTSRVSAKTERNDVLFFFFSFFFGKQKKSGSSRVAYDADGSGAEQVANRKAAGVQGRVGSSSVAVQHQQRGSGLLIEVGLWVQGRAGEG